MAVTAHFLDRQGKHQSRLLALRHQLGCHSEENLAVTLGQVVREWKIEDRVGTVISDNASSNDSCLLNFYGDLDAEMGPADVRARRMRCYGHILSLVARDFLCNRPVDEQRGAIIDTMASPSVPQRTPVDSMFKQWVKSRTARTTVMGSELERYLRLEPQETEDPIEWWMAHQGQFPTVSQLALDILAIPAMATDCERRSASPS